MKASILTIGDEILIGQVVNTNSSWLSKKLNDIGITVNTVLAIGDNKSQITNSLDILLPHSDIILITGGLGPTNDDITKDVLAEYFNTKLIYDELVYKNIENIFEKTNSTINKNNMRQAYVPENAQILMNKYGTAPGMLFKKNEKFIFSLPGVPIEMQYIFETHIVPFLTENFVQSKITHKTFIIIGIPESILAEKIEDWENNLPYYIKVAYLPNYGYIRLRLSIYDSDEEKNNILKQKTEDLKNIVSDNLISEEDISLEELLGKMLKDNQKTVATAESCTGGKIASLITSIPKSSSYFVGSIVSYSNNVKTNILNVNKTDIEKYGAVSQTVVEQMAIGILKLLKTDYSIATSGIAGPDGGTKEKPVGTIWIAVASKDKIISREYHFSSDRNINILRSAYTGINMLIKLIKNN
ncbi:MAG: competence/damage-inducible protein A [Bacteroidales bacterium]|jgi:nicotinamide-nucleotide amidase|nr:competence/damage-inducible protein A [Bacteroidales bacterium]